MKKLIFILLCIYSFSNYSTAGGFIPFDKDPIIEAGNILQVAIPASALLFSLAIKDWEGSIQWLESNGSTLVATQVLKLIVSEERPDGSNFKSFPSGHTSAAFAGASFWQMRYGWSIGAPMYALAVFTGLSRIYADKHYLRDVIFGAALGIGFNVLFTSEYLPKNMSLNFTPIPSGGKIEFTMVF